LLRICPQQRQFHIAFNSIYLSETVSAQALTAKALASERSVRPDDMSSADSRHAYKKEQKVGEGQYAIVYLGRHTETDRKVAIKSIKMGQSKDGRHPPPSPHVWLF
jgi:serine/threonine protein kinase